MSVSIDSVHYTVMHEGEFKVRPQGIVNNYFTSLNLKRIT